MLNGIGDDTLQTLSFQVGRPLEPQAIRRFQGCGFVAVPITISQGVSRVEQARSSVTTKYLQLSVHHSVTELSRGIT
ncbi:hypothetical protein, partial [Ferrimicrobium acidiphilum]|uniref:hypothetical protein n=1 Tax=Ferrimicrobium acidiphilum TaxID=121039 RepID=UPI0023EF8244